MIILELPNMRENQPVAAPLSEKSLLYVFDTSFKFRFIDVVIAEVSFTYVVWKSKQ